MVDKDYIFERKVIVAESLSNLLNNDPRFYEGYAWVNGDDPTDLKYEGSVAPLLEFFEENRSEIEELQ